MSIFGAYFLTEQQENSYSYVLKAGCFMPLSDKKDQKLCIMQYIYAAIIQAIETKGMETNDAFASLCSEFWFKLLLLVAFVFLLIMHVRLMSRRMRRNNELIEINTKLRIKKKESDRMARQLEQSELKYRSLFEHAVEGIFQTLPDGSLLTVNSALANMLGYASPEDLIENEQRAQAQLAFANNAELRHRVAEHGPLRHFETLHKRPPTGQEHHIALSLQAIRNESGDIIYYQGSLMDINAIKQAEKQLEKNLQTQRALMNAPTDSILLIDKHERIVECNKIAAKQLGMKSDELIGKNIVDLYPFELMAKISKQINYVFQTAGSVRYDVLFDKIWFDIVCYPINDNEGHVDKVAFIARDITQDREIRQSLRESESRYRQLANVSFEGIVVHDAGKILEVNPAIKSMLGYPQEEIIGHQLSEFISTNQNLNIENDEQVAVFEALLLRKNKSPLMAEGQTKTFFYAGKHVRVLAVRDVTDRKKMEALMQLQLDLSMALTALFTVKDVNRLVVDSSLQIDTIEASAIYLIDGQNLCLQYYRGLPDINHEVLKEIAISNPMVESLQKGHQIYYTSADLQSKDLPLYNIGLRSTLITPIFHEKRLIGSLNVGSFEHDKIPVYIRHTIGALANQLGTIIARIEASQQLHLLNEKLEQRVTERTHELSEAIDKLQQEIVEREKIEQAYKESREQLIILTDGIPSLVSHIDSELHFLYVNQAFANWHGQSKEALIGQAVEQALPDENFQKALPYYQRVLQGESVAYESILTNSDNKAVNFLTSYVPHFSEDGSVKSFFTLNHDVSELKRVERQLKQAKEQAEAATRAKSEFLANMSHEIRTPMNAVIGFTELLDSLITDEEQKNYLDTIKASGKSLLTLINDILDLSKIEAGRMELVYESFNPRFIFEEVQKIFSLKIKEKGLKFILEITEDFPENIYLDETRLRQILFNLVGNAVKFTTEGHVKLSAKVCNYYSEKQKFDMCLTVIDTGIGIQKSQQERIFEAFKQQDDQNAKLYGGTGLGLTITKRLVEMMNGRIELESESGKGSSFHLHFCGVKISSEAKEQEQESDEMDYAQVSLRGVKVLTVDDNQFNQRLLSATLKRHEATVFQADNGREALKLTWQHKPDIVLMDLRMPVMDGYKALKHIREKAGFSKTPVIALTASAMNDVRQKVLDSGFDGILVKPVRLQDIIREMVRFIPLRMQKESEKIFKDTEQQQDDLAKLSSAQKENILQDIENNLQALWSLANSSHFFDDKLNFVQKLIEFAQNQDIAFIEQYAQALRITVDSFDIDKMNRLFAQFPDIIDKIRQA